MIRYDVIGRPACVWWVWDAPAWAGHSGDIEHLFDVGESSSQDDPDVAWLGELGWAARSDNMGLGLREDGRVPEPFDRVGEWDGVVVRVRAA